MSIASQAEQLLPRILKALEDIRPFLLEDGGDVDVVQITDDLVVEVELLGACKTCSMSNMTFQGGIQQAIMKAVPEVKDVVTISRELV